jgi:hypothetical protein
MKHGGKRAGSGRPKGSGSKIKIKREPTKYLPKVPVSKWEECLKAIKRVLKINLK